ncbi:class I SAM-dependent DNA methyltransferase [Jingyaoa shaoxingensis]|uniref:Class I SAM-dependent methyltransferase n=1 Tax=Jingyaoa shaoxingensis TaxID=2763671 RepID=A0ABR7N9Q1_9FIRM|nr:class I SAM-dependent methyltransferase [Jingyaoa shaoxingensis]MBC8573140.1 class I SAM-dependent methyltransferase [Jingyaoa shaoxingensis]
MYSDIFSRVYDAFGWNYYPESFAQLLLRWIEEMEIKVKSMLDLGCGTGVLCGIMQEHSISTHGMDLSTGMIAMAKEKYPNIPFDVGNMVTWKPENTYDLVTSTCDALNHILDQEDVKKVFRNVYSYVNAGGSFLFDLLREGEAEECEPVDLGELDGKRLQFQIYHPGENLVTLQTDLFDGETLVNTEKIQERLYDPEWIMTELKKAGFSEVQCTDQLLKEHDSHAATWFMIARK